MMNNKQNKKNGKKSLKGSGFSQPARQPQGSLAKIALSMATKALNSTPSRALTGSVKMSNCAGKLAAAIADPFSEQATGACFPTFPSPDSHKVQAFSRFDGAIGTAGVGFIAITPSLAKDLSSGYVTGTAFTGTTVNVFSASNVLNTGIIPFGHNGPYTAGQLVRTADVTETDLVGRVVSVGVRITYTGTNLNESGICTLLSHPTHGNLSGAAISDLQAFGNAEICPFTRKPCDLVVYPTAITDTSYPQTNTGSTQHVYPYSQGDGRYYTTYNGAVFYNGSVVVDGVTVNTGAPIAVITVTGVAGSTFHVDMVYHLEYTGRTAASSLTPNSVDVSSVYAILTAAQQLATRKMASPNASNWALLMAGIKSAMGSPIALTARGVVGLK